MTPHEQLFDQLGKLTTEQRNPDSMDIDARTLLEIVTIINDQDKAVPAAVATQLSYIAQAVDIIVRAFKNGGRLFYFGAGTSGRLGVLDAVECPPTYGTDPLLIQGTIAGGDRAMFRAQEGAEDKEENGSADVDAKTVGPNDVVCGIAASLRTPYVVGAIKRAKQRGAKTLYVTTNPRSNLDLPEYQELKNVIDVAICPDVGPEVIMGSTRMKSGTAQKLVLNMMTTAAMIRMGKVYENMMIDLQMTNLKLRERAKRIVMTITGKSYEESSLYLERADYRVKTALVMIKANVLPEEAQARLEKADGFVRAAIEGKEYRII
ncbi:MAG: N-acetylmuramic acid 6-phosphate etherase [Ignavibacteriales bacterium]|nr:N-acetylmuramic acid 6-phosphate etherase [Ignavibacteriales bacterium]